MEHGGAAQIGPKPIRKIQATSYMLPGGHYWKFVHENRYREGEMKEGWNRFITVANPKTFNKLILSITGLKMMTGCGKDCGVVRDDSIWVLFADIQSTGSYRHAETSQSMASSGMVTIL